MSEVVKREKRDLPISAHGLVPRTIGELSRLAHAMVAGGIAPRDVSPEKAIGIMLAGIEIGMTPIQSLSNICFINGRPTLWGDGVSALLWRSGQLAAAPEEFIEGNGDDRTAVCRLRRKGATGVIERRFSMADAKRAGLLSKDNWQKYPDRQLRWRAFSWAARDGFADVLKGLWTREEAADIEETVYEISEPQPMPQPKEVPQQQQPPQPEKKAETPIMEIDSQVTPPPPPLGEFLPAAEQPNPQHRVFVTQEDEPAGERTELWALWEDYREQLTPEQFREVRSRASCMKVRADITLDNLRAIVRAAEEVLGM